jgi:hypothetical protein
MNQFGPWDKALAGWLILSVCAVPVSAVFWMVGGFAFCGTDTTEPGSAWACDQLVHPVVPWAVIAATPIVAMVIGGWVALRRRDWGLLALFLVLPSAFLVGCTFALLAAF